MEKQSFTVTSGKTAHRIELEKNGSYSGTIDGKEFSCDTISTGTDKFHVIRNNRSYEVEIVKSDLAAKTITVKVNGHLYPLTLKDKYDELLHSLGMDKLHSAKVNELKAPMPGLVLDIVVREGQEVKKGDPLVVLEAMKMENILKSPADVTVKKISVKKGTAVEKNQVLVLFN
ncbi:MAG TPA: biotin/lipoyl-containing protein [Bacteroidia bacterium]|jgi:biotin carboxyl carrier protein|nr:biotin/lipoyl-containing protein [Bacteroidia bacterium]